MHQNALVSLTVSTLRYNEAVFFYIVNTGEVGSFFPTGCQSIFPHHLRAWERVTVTRIRHPVCWTETGLVFAYQTHTHTNYTDEWGAESSAHMQMCVLGTLPAEGVMVVEFPLRQMYPSLLLQAILSHLDAFPALSATQFMPGSCKGWPKGCGGGYNMFGNGLTLCVYCMCVHSPGAQLRYLNGFPLLHCQPLSKSRLFSPIQSDDPRILVNPEKWMEYN